MSTYVSTYKIKPTKTTQCLMKSDHQSVILNKLNEDRKAKHRFCDVTIIAGTGIFPAHLCVLSSYLEFFEKIFSAEMIEKQERIAKIFEIDEETMEAILNYIYTAEISVSKENVVQILKAADFFQIQAVKDFSLKFMFDEVDFENCLSFEAYGKLFDYKEVREKVEAMVSSRLDLVLGEDEFKQLTYDDFNELLSLEYKKITSQEIIYNAIMGWLHYYLDERVEHTEDLFGYVNIEKLSRSFLLNSVLNQNLISTSVVCLNRILDVLLERIARATNLEILNGNTFGTPAPLKDGRRLNYSKQLNNDENGKKFSCEEENIQQLSIDGLTTYLKFQAKTDDSFYQTSIKWIKCEEEKRKSHVYELLSKIVVEDLSVETLLRHVKNEKLIRENTEACHHFSKGLLSRKSASTGNHLMILGGSRRRVFRYDVINKEMTSLPSLRLGRNAACVVRHKKKVYAFGGYKTKSVEHLDLTYSTSNWEEDRSMKQIRVGSAACVFGDFIYVIGGRASANFSSTSHKSSTGDCWDTKTKKWTHVPSCHEAKCFHALVQMNGLLYAIGTHNAEVFHPRYQSWRRLTSLQQPRTGLAAVALMGKIYAIGGYNDEYLASVEVYDPTHDSWNYVASMNDSRSFHGACVINNKIYVAGGNSDLIEVYDPSNNTWEIETRDTGIKWMDCVVAI